MPMSYQIDGPLLIYFRQVRDGLEMVMSGVYFVILPSFIQYFARNWPWYSLRGLHIRITWFSLYGIRIPLFSLYGIHMPLFFFFFGNTVHCSGCGVAMDSPLSRGPLLWRHNDMTVSVSRNTRGPERDTRFITPWQRECTTITDVQSIDSL